MTAEQLFAVGIALDTILSRDLPVGIAVPAAQARKLASETYRPFGERIAEFQAEHAVDGTIPEAQVPAFEMRAKKVLAEEVSITLPVIQVHPNLVLPGSTVAVLVEAGVMEVLG